MGKRQRRYALATMLAIGAAIQAVAVATEAGAASLAGSNAPVAWWGLEVYPGVTQEQALVDRQPALAGDTPLTAHGVAWSDHVRMMDARTATLDGNGAQLTADPAVDTAASFSVAAWVKLSDTEGNDTVVSQDGRHVARFQLQFRGGDQTGDGVADPSWCLVMQAADRPRAASEAACALDAAEAGRWTHVAGVYDAAAEKLLVYVDGSLRAQSAAPRAWSAKGLVRVGAGKVSGTAISDYFAGSVADVRVYDRTLLPEDFVGTPDGTEPGLLAPIEVGRWDFQAAVLCYEFGIPGTCEAPDGAPWGRWLTLSQGSYVDTGYDGGLALVLDGTHWIDDPYDPYYQMPTREQAWSQYRGAAPDDPTQWQDVPVLRTDQSFAVSLWTRLTATDRTQTIVTQDAGTRGAFTLSYWPANGGEWVFSLAAAATADASQDVVAVAPAPDAQGWHQLAMVFDRAARQIRLYVDGVPAATASTPTAWYAQHGDGPLAVGREKTPDGPANWLYGAVDNLSAYQGSLSDAVVAGLYARQRVAA